jgi:hypothetical protein
VHTAVFDVDGLPVAYCLDERNAAFIVRACNAHEELLEFGKAALALLNQHNIYGPICTGLAAAVAKAEGK